LQSAAGIEKATGQLMIASFDSIHCAAAVQIIGFDPWTDFVVAPWIKQELPNGLANGEIVVGSDVVGEPGGTLVFFKRPYIVAAKLRKTGMGFDTSVFINMATARIALEDYAALGGKCPPAEVDPVSSILVNIEPGVDAKNFALDLMQEYGRDKVSVILTRAMVADISQNMHAMLVIIAALIALLWFMAVFVQAVMVGAIINERKRELGIYRVLGATQGKLISLLLTESAIVSAAGAIIGAALCAFLYFSFARLIGLSIHTPYLMPESGAILRLISGGLVLAFLTGPVAALLSTRRAGKKAVETVLTGGR
jgi:putative ABC transport system permease protein